MQPPGPFLGKKKKQISECMSVCVCVQTASLNPLRKNLCSDFLAFLCAQQWCANTNYENEKQTSGASAVKQRRSLKIQKDEKSAALAQFFLNSQLFVKAVLGQLREYLL